MDMTMFDHFPEPVFYVHAGQIRYRNAAAAALEPDWAEGGAIPKALAMEPDGEGVFSCVLGGREFQASATGAEDGLLLVLRNPTGTSGTGVPAALPVQLRDMLNQIQVVSRLLAPLVEENGDDEAHRHLAVLNQSFYRMLRVARHLELTEQAGRGDGSELDEQALDLAELCREVAYGAGKLAEQAGVTFREDVPGGMIPSVGDRELLEILMLELISNAIKAAGRTGEAGLRLSSNGSCALITVWDNGSGMRQSELTAIMDGASPESLPKPGTGLRLGLTIARYAAAAHGGALLLESQRGQGTKATVSIPLRKPGKSKLHTPRVKAEEGMLPMLTLLSDSLPWQSFEE